MPFFAAVSFSCRAAGPAGTASRAYRIVFRDYSAGARHDLGFRVCRYAE